MMEGRAGEYPQISSVVLVTIIGQLIWHVVSWSLVLATQKRVAGARGWWERAYGGYWKLFKECSHCLSLVHIPITSHHFGDVCIVPAFSQSPISRSLRYHMEAMAESCWVVLFKVRWLALIHLTGSLFVDSQCISDVFVIWICNPFENWSERTNWKGATFHMRWDAVKDGLPDLSTSCFRASPHNPSAASDLSTYSTTSLISNEEQFEDYGEGDDVDFTPSSPCPDDETRTNAYSDLGSSVSSRLLLIH